MINLLKVFGESRGAFCKKPLWSLSRAPINCNLSLRSVGLASCGELDDEHEVVGLNLSLVGGATAADLSALGTLGDDDIALFGIRLGGDGLQISSAGVGSVTGIDVHVSRPEAEGAMVAGGVAQGLDLATAMDADKTVVQFGKAFLFHGNSFRVGEANGEPVLRNERMG